MHQPGEPSVEDILESIKLVIARDTSPQAPRMPRRPAAIDDDVLDLADAMAADVTERPMPETAKTPANEAPLVNPASSASMRDSLAALAMLAEPGARPRIVRSGETSLEDLTRELLRPALAEWLESHLPAMVERLVAAEIVRIVGKKG